MAAAVVKLLDSMPPGRALDLACGGGRHSILLAARGWHVTAVDRAPGKMESPFIDRRVADLESGDFEIAPGSYDLILDWLYFQRDLVPKIQDGVRPGGIVAVCFLRTGRFAADPAEVRMWFQGWETLHYAE